MKSTTIQNKGGNIKQNIKYGVDDKNNLKISIRVFKNKCRKNNVVGFLSGSCRFTTVKDNKIGPGTNNNY